jgi:hypothetical protein
MTKRKRGEQAKVQECHRMSMQGQQQESNMLNLFGTKKMGNSTIAKERRTSVTVTFVGHMEKHATLNGCAVDVRCHYAKRRGEEKSGRAFTSTCILWLETMHADQCATGSRYPTPA